MDVIRLHAYGPAANLRLETLPDPVPGPGEVRVAVRAAGVHFIETLLRQGRAVGPHPAPALPAVFGSEVAGVVEAVGEGVPAGLAGRRVVTGAASSGGYASRAVAPAGSLTELPGHVDDGVAVAMVTTGATTFGLLELAPVGPGDVVLAMAAAGGVGSLLVQYARRAGATVVGAAGGPAKAARAAELGAGLAVDYREAGWDKRVREAAGEVTVVFDGVGGELGRAAYGLLGRGGRHVVFGSAAGEWFFPDAGEAAAREVAVLDGIGHLLGRDGGTADLRARALEAAAEGWLTPLVQAFPLAAAAAAHAALESRDTMGKVVLVP
ncbi:zinc-binding dehydrogenase [Actinomadura sp. ATCC 31491]|uniref:Zinc-binding dehydrogenase n=1 Tax=Actinomadura luzonensis TaxID=2805427 RepID=A0ABT0G7D9_9ACTN|nr:zinc-binding dehydrogenase [Actinomadura luzonensis]MCK2220511.1 zinc-binding dehydrogenase [Actinomadura luzonensis]